jgi:5-methylcytosine-specific restriction endonuclease McrA
MEWNIEQWYQGYLLSNMWSKKKKMDFRKHNFKCERCGDKAVQVHHLTYERRVGYELPKI